ncbi:site-2 protease family protein [Fictibacillus fluitans]|uniref:Site-2 protease family protein n=1 Tax=Fictibacillus fluitans TaxID=3058422 RepID=A0ABT8I0K9_9BACL|nr:site-2 protease family protein [Fictibacillus sp. NE201]MDN4526546.1 site-2 protease family protein [Fictibacillus sp. NE201]
MENFMAFNFQELPFVIISLVFAFTIHEFAHAFTAYLCGDPTAKNQGRLTLSPIAHLDPVGTILLLIAGFGWARPVPVDRRNFKRPHLYGILVSIAGPLSNILLAVVGIIVFYSLFTTGVVDGVSEKGIDFIDKLINMLVYLNVLLFVFNLLPVPPLDGYRVLEDLAPDRIRAKMMKYEHFGVILFLVLVLTPLDRYTIYPIFNTIVPAVANAVDNWIRPFFESGI